jgi:hypothetical protein
MLDRCPTRAYGVSSGACSNMFTNVAHPVVKSNSRMPLPLGGDGW